MWQPGFCAGKPHCLQLSVCLAAGLLWRHPPTNQGKGNVPGGIHVVEQRKVLKGEPQPPSRLGQTGVGERREIDAIQKHCPRAWTEKQTKRLEKHGLSGRSRTHDTDESSTISAKGDFSERGPPVQDDL
jgi:hypothetical protein